jgi:peroxiredoxin
MKRAKLATAAGLMLILVSNARAGDIDAKSEQVLREMTEYAQGLKSFRAEVQANAKVETGGTTNKLKFVYSIVGEQPNRLATIARSGEGAPVVVSDGKKLYALVPALNKYVLGSAPASFQAIAAAESLQGTSLGHSIIVGALLPFASYDELAAAIESAKYVGEEKLGPVKCHHLKLTQKLYDWDLWVEIGKKPLPRKMEPDLTKWQKANPTQLPAGATADVIIGFKTWTTGITLKDKDFKIDPPSSAQEVASLVPSPGEKTEGPQALTGLAAPPLSLGTLAGGQMNLADHKGKEIVILDFWATWCGPCVAALPQVSEVAATYRARGVAFYAVNQQEEAATVTQFLTDKQWNIPVAMDVKGEGAQAYRVSGIPQTVIIGRTGKVEVVHVGAGPNLKEQLAGELDRIIAEQPPVASAKAVRKKK